MAVPCPALPALVLFLSVKKTKTRQGKVTTHPSNQHRVLLQEYSNTNNSTRHGSGRHITSRLDADLFSLSFCRSAWLSLFFCRLPFPPPPPHPPVVPESAGANHHRLLPTKKSAVATFSFLSRKFCLLFPFCPPTEPSPALQLHSIPTRIGTGLCNRAGRPVPVSWGWCLR